MVIVIQSARVPKFIRFKIPKPKGLWSSLLLFIIGPWFQRNSLQWRGRIFKALGQMERTVWTLQGYIADNVVILPVATWRRA